MKRFIFSTIALLVAATACTESGLIDSPQLYGSQIIFDTYLGKAPVTKAEDITTNYLEEDSNGIYVYAFQTEKGNDSPSKVDFRSAYMDGKILCTTDEVTLPDETDKRKVWAYYEENSTSGWAVEDVYWPGDVDLAFVAYRSGSAEASGITRNANDFFFNFTVQPKMKDQVDLIVSPLQFVKETAAGDTYVNLQFFHLLSRVGFSVIPTNLNSNVDIAIRSVTLRGAFPKTGKVNLNSTSASIQPITTGNDAITTGYDLFESTECFVIKSSDCVDPSDNTKKAAVAIYPNRTFSSAATIWPEAYKSLDVDYSKSRYMMLMPSQLDAAFIDVEYQLTNAQPCTATVDLGTLNLKSGFAYEFVLKISTASIDFSAEVVEGTWNPTENKDI